MTLKELGYQYLEQEKQLRARLKELQQQGDEENPVLRRRMYYLTREALECRKIGRYLITYYEEEQA